MYPIPRLQGSDTFCLLGLVDMVPHSNHDLVSHLISAAELGKYESVGISLGDFLMTSQRVV